jgi:hypothetical protein
MDSVEAGDILIQPNGSASSDECKDSPVDGIEEDDDDDEEEDDFEARANSAILARQLAKNKALADMHAQRHGRLRSPPPPLPDASLSSSRSSSESEIFPPFSHTIRALPVYSLPAQPASLLDTRSRRLPPPSDTISSQSLDEI